MKKRYLIIIIILALICLTTVSAQENQSTDSVDEKLEKTYYYDADTGKNQVDDTVVTHNMVKYYGDKDTKFKVKVYDNDYKPEKGVYVSFGKLFTKYKEKTTDSNGVVYFPINYKIGTHEVETYIESEDGESYWSAYNTVKIKSTIPTKELTKHSKSKKNFKVKFLDIKGKDLKNTIVKIKIKGKTYKLKTDSSGFVQIKSTLFKIGKENIKAINPVTGEKRKIPVVVLKKGTHTINIRIDDPTKYFPTKKLKNGDYVNTVYETEYKQYYPGVYVECTSGGLEKAKHTKLIKAKFYFKNKKTGKIISKTSRNANYNTIKVNPITGYSPFKAKVWYRDI